MAVIKRMDLERVGHQAVVLNLGDIAAHGERLKDAARAEAAGIVAAARAEREKLIRDARQAGHADGMKAGHEEGMKKGRTEGHAASLAESRERLKAMESAWIKALDEFLAERNAMLDAAKLDLLKLAVIATEKITKRRLEVDLTLVADQMQAAIAEAGRGTALVVRVGPGDVELAREAIRGIMDRFGGASAVVREDSTLSRGSCVVAMAGGGMVDATIETQLQRVAESLLPTVSGMDEAGGASTSGEMEGHP
jgi:flagellar assembly protein FliH